ncbi:P-loop containing nucleoside triphosphate hydrolase protein [Radiomyces spectabilis]|uniref:P-loop containing nucleoside triphosphate hydrolase protein n=1 Tax=Radiomyces spectabilis TaxID=64574 RepID=UPI00221F3A65|nr:P-loop containing nucleoside triphosphate hydrolase protein [Radiomyces spectabilis]KAI8379587.1 P-loop containing nucleoside triphosphate hydrolase protein [Radiomyces spectabilis]
MGQLHHVTPSLSLLKFIDGCWKGTFFHSKEFETTMTYQSMAMLPQAQASLDHILHHRDAYLKDRADRHLGRRPLVVGVSGCQGSGKTTLCDTLAHILREEHNMNVVNFSLDDLYLTRADQAHLAEANPGNRLLQYRGQAGSHDMALARSIFSKLLDKNAQSNVPVAIPSYDKSLFGGLGDRLPKSSWKQVYPPYDVILFEGWMLGFKPLLNEQLEHVYRQKSQENQQGHKNQLTEHPLAHIEKLNDKLVTYERELYPFMDIFIHLSPTDLEQVYQWRLQQEHHMKQTRNVQGLSDEAVRAFVDTYMPAYELYLPRLDRVGFFGQGDRGESLKGYEGPQRQDGGYSGQERHLRLVLDQDRRLIRSQPMQERVVPNAPSDPSVSQSRGIAPKRLLFSCAMIGLLGLVGYSRRQRLMSVFSTLTRSFARKG